MLVDRYDPEDVFARVPEVVQQTDPVLKRLDHLLEDDQLYKQVRADLGKRYRYTLVHGRHSTPVEVILRMLLCKHLYGWSYEETRERVADSLVLRAVLPLDRLPGPEVWVVIRRKVSGSAEEPEWKFYVSNAPIETPLSTFVRVSGMRWPIETCFAECKGELGMDHYELRFWRGWHHHMTLVILAHHFLVRWQQRLNQRGGLLRPTTTRPLPTSSEVLSLDSHPSLPLSVAQVRLLLRVALPQPVLDLPAALALIAYQQRHNYAAYCSHRKRLLAQLQGLRW